MKVVILCGGTGSRIALETKKLPKPMIKIGKKPILIHIMEHYKKQGFNHFILACGYKHKIIKKYFKKKIIKKLKVKVVNTGLNTLTGLRLKRLKKYFNKNEIFYLTYGDGVSDINIKKLLKFHKKNKKIATLTAVHPPARFGELKLKKNKLVEFNEKPQLTDGWINGGFFVFNEKIFKYLTNKNSMLEREFIQRLIKKKNIAAYKHESFWMCMDTSRDKQVLEKIL